MSGQYRSNSRSRSSLRALFGDVRWVVVLTCYCWCLALHIAGVFASTRVFVITTVVVVADTVLAVAEHRSRTAATMRHLP